jgi:hypothetical protein
MDRLLVKANVVPSLPILVTLMMEALRSSETSVLTRATRSPRGRHSSILCVFTNNPASALSQKISMSVTYRHFCIQVVKVEVNLLLSLITLTTSHGSS